MISSPSGRLLAALLIAVAACSGDTSQRPKDHQAAQGPTLHLVDSVRLEERPDAFIGMPIALSVLEHSRQLVIGDAMSGRIFRFASSGALQAVQGGQGTGPGEFTAPGPAVELPDGAIAVSDFATDRLILLERDGTERSRIGVAGLAFSLATDGATIYAGRLARQAPWTAAIRLDAATGVWTPLGVAPGPYGEAPQLRVAHPYVSVARQAGALLVGFTGANQLVRVADDGSAQELLIPAVRRRLLPADLAARFSKPLPDSVIAEMASVLTGLHPIPSGEVATVHLDTRLRGRRLEAAGWVSLLDVAGKRACVDAVLPVRGVGKPLTAVLHDTLLVMEQVAEGGETAPRAMVYKYLVSRDGCDWQPLPR